MIAALRSRLPRGRAYVIALPYLWLLCFFALPFLFVLKISFSQQDIAQPPYQPLIKQEESRITIQLDGSKYQNILDEVDSFIDKPWQEAKQDSQYLIAYWNAIKLAALTTILTLLIGYPLAYNIARASPSTRNTLLMMVMIPFWTSFLLRVYAWIGILKDNGIINNLLIASGVITDPIPMLYTPFSVLIGMVYNYLPFMILPLYAHLVKLDGRLFEAAADLGAKPWTIFFSITLPLSKAGIIAGAMMVFIPAVGEFVIPALLGGGEVVFIGNKLNDDFGANLDWPQASAVAVSMLLLLLAPIIWFHRFEMRQQEAKS